MGFHVDADKVVHQLEDVVQGDEDVHDPVVGRLLEKECVALRSVRRWR